MGDNGKDKLKISILMIHPVVKRVNSGFITEDWQAWRSFGLGRGDSY